MATSNYVSTKETTNFARLSRLLLNVCGDMLRDVLAKRIPSAAFQNAIQLKKTQLLSALHTVQRTLLFPPGGRFQGTYADFDVNMLYVLLRNIGNIQPHTNGWGFRPDVNDRSLSANIERIRLARNEVYGHVTSAAIDDVKFNDIWTELKQNISEIETAMLIGRKYQDAMGQLETAEMDPETAQTFIDMLQAMYIQEQETKTILHQHEKLLHEMNKTGLCTQLEVKQLKGGIENMTELFGQLMSRLEINKNIKKRNKLIETSTRFIKRILSQADLVKISAYDVIMDKLLQEGWAVITGIPGDGKTTLACHMMNDIVNNKVTGITGKQPLVISKPSDWEDVVSPCDNLIIFIDNMFGIYSLCDVKEWKQVLHNSTDAVSDLHDPRRNFLLVAIRTEIYKECIPVIETHPLFRTIIDLSEEANFRPEQKLSILRKYTSENPFTAEEERLVMRASKFIGFPQCCNLFKNDNQLQQRGSNFFERPVYYLKKQLLQIWQIDCIKFSALALVMMNGGKVHESAFTISSSETFNHIKTICRIDSSENIVKKCLHAAHSLVGTYLSHVETSFTFSHDSIHQAVAMVLWKENCTEVVQNCSVKFLTNIRSSGCATDNFDDVLAPEYSYAALAKRVIKEISTGLSVSYKSIVDMKIWEDASFCTEIDKQIALFQSNCPFSWNNEDELKKSLLNYAVGARNTHFVKFLFNKCPSENQCDIALNVACEIGDLFLFELCKENNVHITIETLFSAVKGGNEDIYKILIEAYFDINIKHKTKSNIKIYSEKTTILQEICLQRNLAFLKLSVDKINKEMFSSCKYDQLIIHYASMGGSLDVVKYLIRMGVDVYRLNKSLFSISILHWASWFGHLDIIEYLYLHYKLLFQNRDKCDFTPLHFTAYGTGSLDVATYLISKGLNVHTKDVYGATVLHIASYHGHLSLVKYLCERHSELIQVTGQFNGTPLHYTADGSGSLDVATYLISKGKNVHSKDVNGATVLHRACFNGHLSLVNYLCERYPELIHVTGQFNRTPLHYTAGGSGSVDVATCLISTGMNVHTKDVNGATVLHRACYSGHLSLVKYLYERHPELIHVTGQFNRTPLHYTAGGSGSVDVATYLISKGINVHTKDVSGHTILHRACYNGHLSLVNYLCERHPELIHVTGQFNCTSLHYTAEGSGSVDVATYLISKGLGLNTKDSRGKTVYDIALKKEDKTLIECLC